MNNYAQEHYDSALNSCYPDAQASASTDNELINLIRDFIIDKSLKAQLEYHLKHNPLTPKASHKIKMFFLFALNQQFVTSNIPTKDDNLEQRRLQARYKLMTAQLPLGLTRYDINDTYINLLSGIDHCYQNQLLRARNGFTMKRVSTQTIESADQNTQEQQNQEERTLLQKLNLSR